MNRFAVGIDVGTAYTKALILSAKGEILARSMEKTGFEPDRVAGRCLETALQTARLAVNDLDAIVSTGFARRLVSIRTMAVTDLTAAARGARHLFPGVRTVLDLGGQTVKACRLDESAAIRAFRLNDKCAAGTGSFLERTARIMNLPLKEIDCLTEGSTHAAPISSVCAVFAESEIINQAVGGTPPRDIMHGAIAACVHRAVQVAQRLGLQEDVCLVGGVPRFARAAKLLQKKLPCRAHCPEPGLVQFMAALGAAHIGLRFGQHGGRPTHIATSDFQEAPCDQS